MNSILSPKHGATEIERVDIDSVKKLYQDVDTTRFFMGLTHISKMRCDSTGYTWYAPAQLCGDGKFYEGLYGKDTEQYYPAWRWAWGAALNYIKVTDKVLEIGSGGLQFLKHLNENQIDSCGLEINPISLSKAEGQGLKVIAQTIETFSEQHKNQFDTVVFFEVLEHVYDVHSFLESALKVLKHGGKMIFSVPNNDSFISNEVLKLNLPPHHIGLWTPHSIEQMVNVFDLQFVCHQFEPLLKGHVSWYLSTLEKMDIDRYPKIIRSLYYRLGLRSFRIKRLTSKLHTLRGQTVLSVFEKR